MIVKKYSDMNIAMALFLVDLLISVSAWFVFGAQTGLFSFCGLMAKSLVIDRVIENMNLCKYLTIICSEPMTDLSVYSGTTEPEFHYFQGGRILQPQ